MSNKIHVLLRYIILFICQIFARIRPFSTLIISNYSRKRAASFDILGAPNVSTVVEKTQQSHNECAFNSKGSATDGTCHPPSRQLQRPGEARYISLTKLQYFDLISQVRNTFCESPHRQWCVDLRMGFLASETTALLCGQGKARLFHVVRSKQPEWFVINADVIFCMPSPSGMYNTLQERFRRNNLFWLGSALSSTMLIFKKYWLHCVSCEYIFFHGNEKTTLPR